MKRRLLPLISFLCIALLPSGAAAQRTALKFVQLSDPQLGFFEDNRSMTRDSLNLETAVKEINRLHPSFVVVTGDMVNNGASEKQIACYKGIISKIDRKIKVWHVPGNHDIGKGAADERIAKYIADYGFSRFSFRQRGCTFIGINSCIIKDDNVAAEREQFEWLERELAKAAKSSRAIFVFSHYPIFIKDYDEKTTYSNLEPEKRDKYWSLFRKYGVTAVVAGHLHSAKQSEYDGIGMYTAGPVGRPLGSGFSGVAVWSVNTKEGDYTHKYISLDELCELDML